MHFLFNQFKISVLAACITRHSQLYRPVQNNLENYSSWFLTCLYIKSDFEMNVFFPHIPMLCRATLKVNFAKCYANSVHFTFTVWNKSAMLYFKHTFCITILSSIYYLKMQNV